jgi:glycosyltransferase involved in cell wall biosynthesis
MKIGVDARMLTGPINGIQRALLEISKRLANINHDIIFYSPIKVSNNCPLEVKSFFNYHYKGKISEQIWCQTALPLLAKKDKIDLFWGPAHRLPYFLPKSIAQVLTIHDLVWISHPNTMNSFGWLLEKICMPYSISNADKIMAISNSTRRGLLENFPEVKEKVSVISLGSAIISLGSGTETLKKFGVSPEYILFVGTIEPRKNINRLIEAYSRLSIDAKKQYDLVLVGLDGWGSIDLPRLIKLYGLSENVKLLGYVSDEDLSYFYHHAIFLAMPSLSEGFGLPILEAMSAGIPVLTSNCSSMPEIAGDGALLVDPLSIDSIHSGLEKLLVDVQLRKDLSFNAKKNAVKYSWDKCADDLMNLFEDAMISRKA